MTTGHRSTTANLTAPLISHVPPPAWQPGDGPAADPDAANPVVADDNGVLTYHEPRRDADQIASYYAAMPPLAGQAHWPLYPCATQHLPRTAAALRGEAANSPGSAKLHILLVGDSIVNDTARSGWLHLLRQRHPRCAIAMTAAVRGGTGPQWFIGAPQLQHYILDQRPDLVILGGISMRDPQSESELIAQIRARSEAEIMLLSGSFGARHNPCLPVYDGDYALRQGLARMAQATSTTYLDMRALWAAYIRGSGRPVNWFMRDEVHANIYGEQIIGRLLAGYFDAPA